MEREQTEEKQNGHPPLPPDPMSEPCSRFAKDFIHLFNFIGFISSMALTADETSKIALEALHDTAKDEVKKQKYQTSLERIVSEGAIKRFRSFRQLILQMMLCRAVDNFLTYISELLALIFRTRPETLRSNEKVRLDMILKHDNMEDLVNDLAELRVNRLSYQGMGDLSTYLLDRLGFRLFDKEEDFERAVRIIELRNLIVHNRGVINQVFLSRLPGYSTEIGSLLEMEVDSTFEDIGFLAESAYSIDVLAASKFGIPCLISRESVIEEPC